MDIETKLKRDKTMPGPMEYSDGVDNKSTVATKKHYGQTRFGKQ